MLEFKMTQDLTSPIYADALMIRRRVFIDGQGVPESLEVDDMEAQARLLGSQQYGELELPYRSKWTIWKLKLAILLATKKANP